MQFCKYHPLETASYHCQECSILTCEDCVNVMNNSCSCFLCQKELQVLEHTGNITPFWRRLQESFHYPLNFDALLIIIGIAVLTVIVSYLPFSLVFNLLLTSALFKYSFSCLERTSKGYMQAPDVTDAYAGGFALIFQLIFMVLVVALMIGFTYKYIGPMIGSIVAVVMIIGIPAIIINFAMTKNMFHALNPVSMMRLISSIGLPYGLLLAFIMIMAASVGIISEFIGSNLSLLSLILQSAVSNYYMIVFFHIMGYMIYQYQSELDFDTSDNFQELKPARSVLNRTIANIEVFIKEGKCGAAINLYKEALSSYPEEIKLKLNYFELLLVTKNSIEIDGFSSQYFKFLIDSNRYEKVPLSYKRILKIYPGFQPINVQMRMNMAKICAQKGDSQSVVRLLNGIHKAFPEYPDLIEALELMADALETLPNMQKQAQSCRNFITKVKTSQ